MSSKDIVDIALKETGLEGYKKETIDLEKIEWNNLVKLLGAKIDYRED